MPARQGSSVGRAHGGGVSHRGGSGGRVGAPHNYGRAHGYNRSHWHRANHGWRHGGWGWPGRVYVDNYYVAEPNYGYGYWNDPVSTGCPRYTPLSNNEVRYGILNGLNIADMQRHKSAVNYLKCVNYYGGNDIY